MHGINNLKMLHRYIPMLNSEQDVPEGKSSSSY
jgi:hypothetical protein